MRIDFLNQEKKNEFNFFPVIIQLKKKQMIRK